MYFMYFFFNFQTFPAYDGWPFPTYYGACGRYIAVSYEGEPLQNFFYEPFHKRVKFSHCKLAIPSVETNKTIPIQGTIVIHIKQ